MSRCKCQKPPHKSIESSTEEEEQRASERGETNRVAEQKRRNENEGQKESRQRTAANEGRRDGELGINEEDREVKVSKRWGNFRKIGLFPKCSHENKMIVYSSSPNLSDVCFCAKTKFKFF
jgi:hypothetical protein